MGTTFFTSTRPDGEVTVTLHGTSGKCTTSYLDREDRNDFEMGQTNCFFYNDGFGECSDYDIGTLEKADVHLHGNHLWPCEKLRVGSHFCYVNEILSDDLCSASCAFE